MEELKEFLKTIKLPGRTLFAKVWGSRSHDTHLPDSDWDFSGVYAVPTIELFKLNQPPETIQRENPELKPDYSFHEVGKFCNLLLKGNPGILEMLFTELFAVEDPDWIILYDNRKKFLSRQAIGHYIGYAEGQLKRLKAGTCLKTSGSEYNTKWAYHMLRLLNDANRIATGGEPEVWKHGVEKKFLMDVRHGVYSPEEVECFAQEKIKNIRATDVAHLPEQGDAEFLENWLVSLRRKELR